MNPASNGSSRRPRHDVAVILVGLDALEFVKGCLDSLQRAGWRGKTYEVVYVDNGSSDGTCRVLAAEYPWVKVIENGHNAGYCKAANEGARHADSRYYYFINDDTLVVDDAIALLVEFMDAHPEVGTAGSRLLYPDGSEQYSGRTFPTLMSSFMGRRSPLTRRFPDAPWVRRYLCKDQLEKGEPFRVDWVSAAGQIFRPADFWKVGGYDESYYYWHEAVICHRLARAGREVMLHPQSKVIHYEGKGSGRRTYRVQKFHILDFHRGAFRCQCELRGLGRFHPVRFAVGALLGGRAAMQLARARLQTAWRRRAEDA
jgi:N-acetylglucosaminyl-diphospho-decaprenol L-rhamnosyltransferase